MGDLDPNDTKLSFFFDSLTYEPGINPILDVENLECTWNLILKRPDNHGLVKCTYNGSNVFVRQNWGAGNPRPPKILSAKILSDIRSSNFLEKMSLEDSLLLLKNHIFILKT